MDAARYWAIGPQITNEDQAFLLEQMIEMNASPEQIEQFKEKHAPQTCEVLEENAKALEWFLSVDDLFINTGYGLQGLDVMAIQADAKMRGLEFTPQDYEKLRIIGRHAAHEYNKKVAKKWQ